jgi:hypothetical protein
MHLDHQEPAHESPESSGEDTFDLDPEWIEGLMEESDPWIAEFEDQDLDDSP